MSSTIGTDAGGRPVPAAAAVLLLSGGAVAAIGTLLPWYGFCVTEGACVSAAGVEDPKGVLALVAAAAVAGTGAAGLVLRGDRAGTVAPAAGIGLALIGIALAAGALVEQSGLDPGGGLFLSIAGSAAAAVGGAWGLVRRRAAPRSPGGPPGAASPRATGERPPDTRGAPPA